LPIEYNKENPWSQNRTVFLLVTNLTFLQTGIPNSPIRITNSTFLAGKRPGFVDSRHHANFFVAGHRRLADLNHILSLFQTH